MVLWLFSINILRNEFYAPVLPYFDTKQKYCVVMEVPSIFYIISLEIYIVEERPKSKKGLHILLYVQELVTHFT